MCQMASRISSITSKNLDMALTTWFFVFHILTNLWNWK
jgi:hypothetical protein